MRSPTLLLLFKIFLAIWSPFTFHMNFSMDFSVSEKKNAIWILMGILLNLQSLDFKHLQEIGSSPLFCLCLFPPFQSIAVRVPCTEYQKFFTLCNIVIVTILTLVIHDCEISFYSFRSLISFSSVLKLSVYKTLVSLVKFIYS